MKEINYKDVFYNTGTAIVILKENGIIEEVNGEFENLSGYSKNEVEGKKHFTEFVHPDDLKRVKEYHSLRRQQPDKVINRYEFKFVDCQQNLKMIKVTVTLVSGNGRSIASLIDITRFKESERNVKERERLFRSNFENTNIGMAILGLEGQFINVNQVLCDMLGYQKEKLKKLNFMEITYSDDKKKSLNKFEQLLHGKIDSINKLEKKYVHKTGKVIWLYLNATLIRDEQENPLYIICHINEITRQKEAEYKLNKSYQELENNLEVMVNTLSSMVELKDPYTADHQQHVAKLAAEIGKKLKLPEPRIKTLKWAGLLHDIGKVKIPSAILSKPGGLIDEEFTLIKRHPQVGYKIVEKIDFSQPIADIIEQHHERIDGSGYPGGLKGKQILLEAKILGVADVVEAMSSHRPYRPALGIDKALTEISNYKNKKYDKKVVEACIEVFKDNKFIMEKSCDSKTKKIY